VENLYLTLDYGSSALKCLCSNDLSVPPQHFVMEPEIISVQSTAIEAYRHKAGFKGDLIAHAFIGIDGCYEAVGKLARQQFQATSNLAELKSSRAVQRTCAAIWVAAQKCSLGKKFRLFLSCLLPPGELMDRDVLERDLQHALKSFDTPTGKHQVSMSLFSCHPEGGGLSLWYLDKRGDIQDRSLGVIMMGHRNVSCFRIEAGVYQKFRSSNLGFATVVSSIQDNTAGYTELDITRVVAPYLMSKDRDRTILHQLLLQQTSQAQAVELEKLLKAIEVAKSNYWNALSQWLSAQLPKIDEIVVGGGVAELFRAELIDRFRDKLPNMPGREHSAMFFHGGLKYPDGVTIPSELQHRFADVYCLWEKDTYSTALHFQRMKS
jgi:hypothetical protein